MASIEQASNDVDYDLNLVERAYQDREQSCSYQDYLKLITLATFNEHEMRHLQVRRTKQIFRFCSVFIDVQKEKFKNHIEVEIELLKRWKKLPIEEKNRFENEAIDNDIFHQIAFTHMLQAESTDDKRAMTKPIKVRQELEFEWNRLPEVEKTVHKRVVTNRDIERRRCFLQIETDIDQKYLLLKIDYRNDKNFS